MTKVEEYGIALESDTHDRHCLENLVAARLENLTEDMDVDQYTAASRAGWLWVTLEEQVRDALDSDFFVCECHV
jgi:hypothetical protein